MTSARGVMAVSITSPDVRGGTAPLSAGHTISCGLPHAGVNRLSVADLGGGVESIAALSGYVVATLGGIGITMGGLVIFALTHPDKLEKWFSILFKLLGQLSRKTSASLDAEICPPVRRCVHQCGDVSTIAELYVHLHGSGLDVQVADVLRVRLDELLARRNLVAHEHVEDLIGQGGVFQVDA